MIVYIIIILILLIGSYSSNSKGYYRVALGALLIISAFRDPTMAGDFPNYERIFNDSPFFMNLISYEADGLSEYTFGYILLNSISKSIVNEYWLFQILYSIISILLLSLVFSKLRLKNKEKCYILLALFCFSFIWYFWNILRQNLANLLYWLFLIWYFANRPCYNIRNCLIIFCGLFIPSLFHSSALINFILFPIMIIVGRIPAQTRIKIFVPISFTIYMLSSYVFGPLLNIMVNIIAPRYEMYIDASAGNGNIINYLLKLSFFIMFSINYDKENYRYKKLVLDTLTMVILISSVNQELINRVYEYYAIGLYLSFGFVSHYFRKINKELVSFVFAIGLIIIFIRFIHISCDGGFLEYKFL